MFIFITTIIFICVLLVGPLLALLIPFPIIDLIQQYSWYMVGALFSTPFILGAIYVLAVGLNPVGFLRPRARYSTLDIEQFFVNPVHVRAAQMIEQVMSDYRNRAVTRPEKYGEKAAADFRRYFHLMEVYRDRGFQFHWRLGIIDPQQMRVLRLTEHNGAIIEYTGECQHWVERNGVQYRAASEHMKQGMMRQHIVIRLQYVETAPDQYRLLAWEDNAVGLHLHTILEDGIQA